MLKGVSGRIKRIIDISGIISDKTIYYGDEGVIAIEF